MKELLLILICIIQSLTVLGQREFISPDGTKRASINKLSEKKYQVIVNGVKHGIYKEIINDEIYFLKDNSSTIYMAKCKGGYCIVIDGIEQSHYKKIYSNRITFSPDFSQYAYMVLINRGLVSTELCYVINGKEQKHYENLSSSGIVFSPDSKHWAYGVLDNNLWFYVIDGKEQHRYNQLSVINFTFSTDSQHWKYSAEKNNKWYYIIDGVETEEDNSAALFQIPLISQNSEKENIPTSKTDSLTESSRIVSDTIVNNEIANNKITKSIAYNLYAGGYRDLIVSKKGDSIICKINDEDNIKVYLSLLVNDQEVETFIEKDKINFMQEGFYTSVRKSKVNYPKNEPLLGSYFSILPCIIDIGGDFEGEIICTEETRCSMPGLCGLWSSHFIPKINPGIGYDIKFGIIKKYKHLGFGLEASYLGSWHNGAWGSYDMIVKYRSFQLTSSLLYMITDDVIWSVNFSYPFDKLIIKDGEYEVTDWDNYTIERVGDSEFINSKWNPIPLNVGSGLDILITDGLIIYLGIDYQIKSEYQVDGFWGSDYYYDNSGLELPDMTGLSSKLLKINAGLKVWL